ADPNAYGGNWSNWDSLVIEAHKRGLRVLATVTGPAPTWYAGMTGKFFQGSRYPSAKAFGEFMTAVGRRYSGQAKAADVGVSRASRVRARSADLIDPLTLVTDPLATDPLDTNPLTGVTDPPPPPTCVPLPPLVSCDPN